MQRPIAAASVRVARLPLSGPTSSLLDSAVLGRIPLHLTLGRSSFAIAFPASLSPSSSPALFPSLPSSSSCGRRWISSGTTNGVKWFDSSLKNVYHANPGARHWLYTTLGTISTMPSPLRGVSAGLLQMPNGFSYLFDAGEGTAAKMRECRVGGSSETLRAVFITHLHGDHVYGLPAVVHHWLLSIRTVRQTIKERRQQQQFKSKTDHRLQERAEDRLKVFGPEGLYEFLYRAFEPTMTTTELQRMPFDVYELMPSKDARSPPSSSSDASSTAGSSVLLTSAPFGRHYKLYANDQGIYQLVDEADHFIKAAPIKHSVECFGYVAESKTKRHVLPEKLAEKGIPPSALVKTLVEEGKVVSPKDGSIVTLEEVSVLSSAAPTKIVVLGDTCDPSQALPIASGCDLLVHETTMGETPDRSEAIKRRHSTAEMAGEFARACNAKQLLLTHFGNRGGHEVSMACLSHLGQREIRTALNEGAQAWLEECGGSAIGGGGTGGGTAAAAAAATPASVTASNNRKATAAASSTPSVDVSEALASHLHTLLPSPLPSVSSSALSSPSSVPSANSLANLRAQITKPVSKDLVDLVVQWCTRWAHFTTEPQGVSLPRALARGILETKRQCTVIGGPTGSKTVSYQTSVQENAREILLRVAERLFTPSNFVVELADYAFPPVPEVPDALPYINAAKRGAKRTSEAGIVCARDFMTVVVERAGRDEVLQKQQQQQQQEQQHQHHSVNRAAAKNKEAQEGKTKDERREKKERQPRTPRSAAAEPH